MQKFYHRLQIIIAILGLKIGRLNIVGNDIKSEYLLILRKMHGLQIIYPAMQKYLHDAA